MIWNVVDHRTRPYRWKRINAIVEPLEHDNSRPDSDQAEPASSDLFYDQGEAVSLAAAIDWAQAIPVPVTLYLYDDGAGTTIA